MNIYFARFRFSLKLLENVRLPAYKGSTFRGGFGHAFRRVLCVERERECEKCPLRCRCVYSYVFETSTRKERLKDLYVPRPFIIEPPLEERQRYGIDDKLDFHLILIGRAVDCIPYFIFAFEEVGRRGIGKNKGKYRIEEVKSITRDSEMLIYDSESHIKEEYGVIYSADLVQEVPHCRQVTLRFLTPTRIKYRGKLTKDIDFEVVMRNLLRRLSSLAEVHCEETWNLDWTGLINRAKEVNTVHSDVRWHDWERYSQRQGTKLKMGGFLGDVTFEGELSEFLPLPDTWRIPPYRQRNCLWTGEI